MSGIGVLVSGIGVRVSVGIGVFVGGTAVGVLVGRGVFVEVGAGVLVGLGVEVGTRVGVAGSRVLRGMVGVIVTNRLGVSDGSGVREGVGVSVGTAVGVAVGTKTVTTCSVNAAAVSRLETARSRMLMGTSVTVIRRFKSPMAMAETLQSRLSPSAPAAKIPSGPEYSLALGLDGLLWRGGDASVLCVLISIDAHRADREHYLTDLYSQMFFLRVCHEPALPLISS